MQLCGYCCTSSEFGTGTAAQQDNHRSAVTPPAMFEKRGFDLGTSAPAGMAYEQTN